MTVNTLGSDSRLGGDSVATSKSRDSRTVAEWLWPFLAQGVALFSISALFYCHFHRQGLEPGSLVQHAVVGLYDVFGLAPSVVFFLMVFAWASIWLFTGILERPMVRVTKLLVMVLMLGVFFNLGSGGVSAGSHTGSLGAWIAGRLVVGIGYVPSIVLVWPTMFASVMLATDWFFTEWFERDRTTTNFEVGVEDAVTDHLRGLSSVANTQESAERPSTLDAAAAAAAVVETAEPVEHTEPVEQTAVAEDPVVIEPMAPPEEVVVEEEEVASEPVAVDEQPADEPQPEEGDYVVPARPLSYAERRRQRAERRSVAAEEAVSTSEAPVAAEEPLVAAPVTPEPVAQAVDEASTSGAPLVGKEELAALFGTVREDESVEEEVVVAGDADDDDDGDGVDYEDGTVDAELEEEVGEEEADEEEAEEEYEDEDVADEDVEYEEESDEEEEVDDEEEVDEEEEELEDDEEEYEYVEVDEEDDDEEVDEEEADDEELADEVYVHVEDQDDEQPDVVVEEVAEAIDAAVEEVVNEDAEEAREVAETIEADGSVVSIPRPEEPPPVTLPTPPAVAEEREQREDAASKQQKLFGGGVDEDLLLEAIDVVNSGRRTTATLLQRKLRIEYELAVEVLDELTSRGLLSGDEDRS